ncbi:GNAT family N-acetyltransferase [Tenacibaculum jejuense]|uniref:GCN5-related N-acetyltransferase n=1 Tax=Tenacibaculum jejuense TaxID=584609 RepID=A0A238UGW4_9FLAO|nr:GNAT family N-acetyltransferase [Tenacibaculum jejuense]SNR17758.1 GCN5-related N-acetyltransferase [Tenacibaculum jejuense]
MISLVRTDSENKDFRALVKQLDAFLAVTDGDDHDFYNQYNKLDLIKHVVLIYVDNEPLACGAIKQYDTTTMEIKRMFTSEKARGKGLASQILKALEIWAKELSFNRCILETGIRQVEAVHLYKKNNYKIIENYGQYSGLEESICFEKRI